jgi:sugar phosphate isomerase/epimerase
MRLGILVAAADATRPLRENIQAARGFLPDLVAFARDHGVKLAIENCPMIFSQDEWPGGHNLFYAPATWREIFGWFDDDTLGLNLDPSHLVWQMIDIERVVREFGSRLHHVHAKDLQIDREGLYERGIMSAGIGWQVPRLPGLGEVRWDRFLAALYQVGYDGCVVIEHEDRGFEGSDEKIKAGFLLARNAVAPYVVEL